MIAGENGGHGVMRARRHRRGVAIPGRLVGQGRKTRETCGVDSMVAVQQRNAGEFVEHDQHNGRRIANLHAQQRRLLGPGQGTRGRRGNRKTPGASRTMGERVTRNPGRAANENRGSPARAPGTRPETANTLRREFEALDRGHGDGGRQQEDDDCEYRFVQAERNAAEQGQ